VAELMSGLLLIARETVILETPNSRAMSARVTGMVGESYIHRLFSARKIFVLLKE
jgi:hypothetical protein